jgi:tetratricopeptide (TPR) repeat protein
MENFIRLDHVRRWLTALLLMVAFGAWSRAAEITNAALESVDRPATNGVAEAEQQRLRTYLKLQEQLHSTLLAIEQARQEASQETRANADALTARLAQLEKALSEQREQQVQTMHASNRSMLVMAGSIVGLGLLALAFTALFQSRGMNRLAEIATGFSHDRALMAGSLPGDLGQGERLLLGVGPATGANKTLLATIGRLEQRLQELEHTAQLTLPLSVPARSNGESTSRRSFNGDGNSPPADHVSVLLGKGQVMLSLGQADGALACFDEAIAAAPEHAETHLKRGLALERLKRWDEAVASYDRAIELNRALTQAYLGKGSVFNRQERYTEALACYEQALRSESKG